VGKSVHNVFGLACIRGLKQVPMPILLRLRCSWTILEHMRILRRFQFTRLFIEFVQVWQRNDSSVVIQTWSWCGKHAANARGMSAESKRWSLAFYNSIRICHMFHISKCRGRSDLGLCTTLVLVKTVPLQCGDFWLTTVLGREIRRNLPMRICILFASTEAVHRPKSECPLPLDFEHMTNSHAKLN